MIAGLILADSLEEDCSLAFLDEKLETFQVETNDEIVELIEEKEPEVLAVDVGTEQGKEEFTKQEKELKEEGYIFTPNSHQTRKVERMQSLERHLNHAMGGRIQIIRFEPQITARELAIDSEQDLKSIGVEGDIGSVEEFDAVLGAVTARFYSQGQFEDLGVVVPEPLDKT
jgi:predicted nuclease with RNAse H fold